MDTDARIGIGFTPFETRAKLIVATAAQAEAAGLDSFGLAEGWGYDASVLLGRIASETSTLSLATSVLSVWSRTPAAMAMAAATLQTISAGRFSLGLGASSKPLVEGLHGRAWEEPFARIEITLRTVRALLDGGRAPQPMGGARPLRLASPPVDPMPINLGALAPPSIRIAGELADGWTPFLWARTRLSQGRELLESGRRNKQQSTALRPAVPLALAADESGARRLAQGWLKTYLSSMGPVYPRLLRRWFGISGAVDAVLDADGDELPPAAEELAREVTLFGTFEEAPELIAEWAAGGIDELQLVLPIGVGEQDVSAMVEAVAAARTRAGTSPSKPGRRVGEG